MSGGTIPYHLRQNKNVERNIFLEILRRFGLWKNISAYQYIGFGGPFLEDFKAIHGAVGIKDMVSIEADAQVEKRQQFNCPISCVKLRHVTSGDFINEFEFSDPCVVWLDYTKPRELAIQLSELQLLATKLKHGDLFKITLNANQSSLGRPQDNEDLREYRLAQARDRLGEYCPSNISEDSVTSRGYPNLLLAAVEKAVKKGLAASRSLVVELVGSYVYSDGQQMVTATAVILEKAEREAFYSQTRFKHLSYFHSNWEAPLHISVPEFSTRERLYIEALLPDQAEPEMIIDRIGYYIGANREDALKELQNFLSYYRAFPWFARISL